MAHRKLNEDQQEFYDRVTQADYGPIIRVFCMPCQTATLIQVSEDKEVGFCPHCGTNIAGEEEDDDDEEFEEVYEH